MAPTWAGPDLLMIHLVVYKCLLFSVQISKNRDLFNLSRMFWMVEMDADTDSELAHYLRSSGKYVPRVIFLDKYGRLIKEATNEERKRGEFRKYFYEDSRHLVETISRLTNKVGPRVRRTDL